MCSSTEIYLNVCNKWAFFLCYISEGWGLWSSGRFRLFGQINSFWGSKLYQFYRVELISAWFKPFLCMVVYIYLILLTALNTFVFSLLIGVSSIYLGPIVFPIIGDSWSTLFLGLLRLISGIVFLWSYYYIDGEENYNRFISIVMRFVRSIVFLIFFGRFFGAIIGWDGLGVTSFLLVIYYKNRKSLGSGIITALTNRLGDCFLLVILGVSLYRREIGTLRYFLLIFILLTSMTKRAQIPFSSWLPSAIAAPTPVRALVHSSTLVTAGVYLLIRFNFLRFEWILAFGRATIIIAGFCACAEIDIKKIVALSTLSQLGVMIVSLSLTQKDFCFFHLITHAIFKALLFMCVGVGIHTIYGSQDFRRFSGTRRSLLWPRTFLLVSNLSLLGFPFMSGFYRKDLVLERFYSNSHRFLMGVLFLLGVGLTTSYSIKIMNLATFGKESRLPRSLASGGFRWQLKVPMSILGVLSVLSGYILSRIENYYICRVIVFFDKLSPLIIISLGYFLGKAVSNLKLPFLSSMWNLRSLFQKTRDYSHLMNKTQQLDNGWVEMRGGLGISNSLENSRASLHPIMAIRFILIWVSLY